MFLPLGHLLGEVEGYSQGLDGGLLGVEGFGGDVVVEEEDDGGGSVTCVEEADGYGGVLVGVYGFEWFG